MALEAGFVQLDRMAVEQGLVATAAAWSGAGARSGDAIRRAAVWADDMNGVTHGAFLTGQFVVIAYGAGGPGAKELKLYSAAVHENAVRVLRAVLSVSRLNDELANARP